MAYKAEAANAASFSLQALFKYYLIKGCILYHTDEGFSVVYLYLVSFHIIISYRRHIHISIFGAVNIPAPGAY